MPFTDDTPASGPAFFAEPGAADPVAPALMETLGAAFRQSNEIGSLLAMEMPAPGVSPAVNPWDRIQGTDLEPHFERFADDFTDAEFEATRRQIEMERADRRMLDDAGLTGMLLEGAAAVASPTMLLPFGQAVGGVRAGASALRMAGAVGLAAGGEAALSEFMLHQSQMLRTGTESAVAIGGSVVLGALLGGAAGAALAKTADGEKAFQRAAQALEGRAPQIPEADLPTAQAAGAEVVRRPVPEDFALPTRGATLAYRATPAGLSFNDRFAASSVPEVREIGARLTQNEFAYAGTNALDLQPAVETMARVAADRAAVSIAKGFRSGFREYRQAGGELTRQQFHQEVSRAMRRDDQHPDEHVRRAAEAMRAEVVTPLKDEAVRMGLLPEGVKVTTAASYFTRLYDQNKIIARENEFLDRVTEWISGQAAAIDRRSLDDARVKLAGHMTSLQALTDEGMPRAGDAVRRFLEQRGDLKSQRARLNRRSQRVMRRPVTQMLKSQGGIDPQGPAARELRAMGITPKTVPGLFKRGGLRSIDNIDADLLRYDGLGDLGDEFDLKMRGADGEALYFDQQRLLARVAEEASGAAPLSRADADAVEALEALDEILAAGDAEARFQGRTDELQRIRELSEKVAKLSDAAYEAEMRASMTPEDRSLYAREMAREVYDTITGADTPLDTLTVAFTRGPLKERTFNIPDELIEDFLEGDAEVVLNRYATTMATEVELTRRFGRADMKDQLELIDRRYRELREQATTEKERTKLRRERDRVMANMEAARDLLRGNYMAREKNTPLLRAQQAAMTYNFVRALGGVTTSALPDVFKLTMVNGIMPVARDALVPMIRNLKNARIAQQDAAEAAGVSEILLNSRMQAIADISNPYAHRTPVENFIEVMGRKSALFSGVLHWNQWMKEIAAYMTTAQMRRGDLSPARLKRLKLTDANAARIRAAMEEHGEEIDGVFHAHVERWDRDTARIWNAAVRADTDTVVVTPGVGDRVPVIEQHPLLKPALQFKAFALASHRKTTMVGLAENQGRFVTNALLMASMGMFVYWLKAMSYDGNPSDNPGTWLAEGIDRSGVVPLVMEVNNMAERLGFDGVYAQLGNAFGESEERASRYAVRNMSGALLGPTAGILQDTAMLARSGFTMEFGPAEVGSMRRLTPFGNHPGVKELLNWYIVPETREAVE